MTVCHINSFQPGTCSGSETTGEGCVLTCSSGYELNRRSRHLRCFWLVQRARVPALTSMNARETRADQVACAPRPRMGSDSGCEYLLLRVCSRVRSGSEQAACTDVNECAGIRAGEVACAPRPRMESLRRWIRFIVRVRPVTKTVVSRRRAPMWSVRGRE